MNCSHCTMALDIEERRPKMLTNCGHTICLVCLKSLTLPQCPICKQVFTAGKEIPDNLYIIELLHERKQQLTVWCKTCKKFAGQGCEDHNYVSVTTMLTDSFKQL